MMVLSYFRIPVELLLITIYILSLSQVVFTATCFLDLVYKYIPLQNIIPPDSKDVEPSGMLVEKLEESFPKNDENVDLGNEIKEIFKKGAQEQYSKPLTHDIDDKHSNTQPLTSILTRPDFSSESARLDDAQQYTKLKKPGTFQHHENFLNDYLRIYLSGSFTSTIAVFTCCLLLGAFLHCSLVLHSLKQKIAAAVKNEAQTVINMKETETQTCMDVLPLKDEISSANEMIKVFSHIKMLTAKMKSSDSTREEAERYLTDEILHLIACRIVRVEFMKNSIEMLYPDMLLRLGKMYKRFVYENSAFKTNLANDADGDNLHTVKINLGVVIDKTGVIRETNSELEKQ